MIKPGSGAGDRRRVCRYRVVLEHAFLGWWHESRLRYTCQAAWPISRCTGAVSSWLDSPICPRGNRSGSISTKDHRSSGSRERSSRSASRSYVNAKSGFRSLRHSAMTTSRNVVYGPEYLRDDLQPPKPEHEWDQFWK